MSHEDFIPLPKNAGLRGVPLTSIEYLGVETGNFSCKRGHVTNVFNYGDQLRWGNWGEK